MVIATTKAEPNGKFNRRNGKTCSEINPVGHPQWQFHGVNGALLQRRLTTRDRRNGGHFSQT